MTIYSCNVVMSPVTRLFNDAAREKCMLWLMKRVGSELNVGMSWIPKKMARECQCVIRVVNCFVLSKLFE